jgi:signal peptidase I
LGHRQGKARAASAKDAAARIETQSEEAKEKGSRSKFQEYAEAIVVAIVLAIIIRAFFVQAFKIPSSSMEPTLLIGDYLLVNKFIYGVRLPFTDKRWPMFRSPERGDVIVFVFPEDRSKDFIKRVVAIPGDTIEVRSKKVILNGKEIQEPYAHYRDAKLLAGQRDNHPPRYIPEGYLFVMGDNRDFSQDSRVWGLVPIEDVKGTAFLIYYSCVWDGFSPKEVRWERLFSIIR